MKKIVTALDNPKVNYELSKSKKFNVLAKDISYQDGIFEILEKEKPDILLLSEILPGKLNMKKLILKIKEIDNNIEIVIFLEKENNDLIKFLKLNDIYNIFYNNKITIKELLNKLESKKIKNEIIDIKNIILNKKHNFNNNYEKNTKKKLDNCKVLSIIGPSGSGKTLFTCMLADLLNKNKKMNILIMDFDILNKNINMIFKNKYKNKKENKNIDIILGKNIMFENDNIEYLKIKEIVEELKKEYDLIIIDTSSECYFNFTKKLIKLSDNSIFISGTNILEIKKSKNLLKIYISEWGIDYKKINIIFNKYNNYSIDEKILFNLFNKYKIIGKINLDEKYNYLINCNLKNIILNKKINNNYKKIIDKLYKKAII